jgi:hypothetical protein
MGWKMRGSIDRSKPFRSCMARAQQWRVCESCLGGDGDGQEPKLRYRVRCNARLGWFVEVDARAARRSKNAEVARARLMSDRPNNRAERCERLNRQDWPRVAREKNSASTTTTTLTKNTYVYIYTPTIEFQCTTSQLPQHQRHPGLVIYTWTIGAVMATTGSRAPTATSLERPCPCLEQERPRGGRGSKPHTRRKWFLHQLLSIGCVSSKRLSCRTATSREALSMFGASTTAKTAKANENIRRDWSQIKTSAEPIPSKLEQFLSSKDIEKKQQ